jgi:hypothetical protein
LNEGIDSLIYFSFMVVTGFQSVLSRVYALQERLYPAGKAYVLCQSGGRADRKIAYGSGWIGFHFYALLEWRLAGFGLLDIEHIARIVISSGLTITLGIETTLFSFLLSTLGMNVGDHPTQFSAERRHRDRQGR